MSTKLKDRIRLGLDETRMLVLVVQVLTGFECRAAFEPRFQQLPPAAQILKLVSFGLLIVTLALLLCVPALHRIGEDGENTPEFARILRTLMACALLPFALALAADVAIGTLAVLGPPSAFVVGIATAALALFFWYVWERMRRRRPPQRLEDDMKEEPQPTELKDKIKQVLTECRIVLPGTQAFLGFQLSAFLTESFTKLSRADQMLHLAALIFVAISGILLMTPPAYHRLAENGEMTHHFHRLASKLLLAAMLPLALGISLDFYVVLSKVTAQTQLAFICAALAFATFVAFWFVFPFARRNRAAVADAHEEEEHAAFETSRA